MAKFTEMGEGLAEVGKLLTFWFTCMLKTCHRLELLKF